MLRDTAGGGERDISGINRLIRWRFQPLRHFVTPPLYFVSQNTGEEVKQGRSPRITYRAYFFIITKLQFTKQKIKNVTTHIREVTLSINSYNSYQLLSAGFTDTYERFSLHLRNTTVPFTNANNVWSFPIPTFSPG